MKRISSNSSHASLPLKIGKFVALKLCKKSPYVLCRLFKKHDIKEDNGESFDVPDMDLEKALEGFWDASPEQHFDSKIFSPLHSQMHSELGSTYLNNYGMVNSGNEHNGMQNQNQYGTNGMDFLETFMVESEQFSFDDSGYNKDGSVAQISIPEVHVKDHEYSSESDGEVIQVQPASRDIAFGESYILQSAKLEENPVFHIPPKEDSSSSGSSNVAFASNGDYNNFDTGIIIRSRQTQRAGPSFSNQGTAPRRIRLQTRSHVGPVSTQASPTMPMVTEEKEAKHSPTASDAASTTASDAASMTASNAASTTASDDTSTTASDDTSTTGGGFDQELSSKVKPKAEFLICFRVHMPKITEKLKHIMPKHASPPPTIQFCQESLISYPTKSNRKKQDVQRGTMAELLEACHMIEFMLTERYLPLLWRMGVQNASSSSSSSVSSLDSTFFLSIL
ncbi:hypothetical protein Tco_0813878 [Tanacetum coccineum]